MGSASEWLETDGLGGFASGTATGIRTRRYHSLLTTSVTPPTDRRVMVSGVDAWVEIAGTSIALTSQAYLPEVVHPDGMHRIATFRSEPWPTWEYDLGQGHRIKYELFMTDGVSQVVLRWSWVGTTPAHAALVVRPFLAFRDYHALARERSDFEFAPRTRTPWLVFQPQPQQPALAVLTNGEYQHDPHWYRGFRYDEERARGFDYVEDLAAPGVLRFDWASRAAICLLSVNSDDVPLNVSPVEYADQLRQVELSRRLAFETPLHRAAAAYVVHRGRGRTIVAGYPWFTDWGRDTFIAVRGLCTAVGDYDTAADVLLQWADSVFEGMLPNRFPDHGQEAEYNSVDASLWFVIAVYELIAEAQRKGSPVPPDQRRRLELAVGEILNAYVRGTRYGIHVDRDGLLAAGAEGVQLTWMDARVGDHVVTPRIGKPVEVQALWWNVLVAAAEDEPSWRPLAERARTSFISRFWNADTGSLYDVVDVDHRPGTVDASVRPNQIFAVGGLPQAVLQGRQARRVVDLVERRLWTPLGLRTLDPDDRRYVPRYFGGPEERDAGYHQGTAWPWLLGPFVEAWLRVRNHRRGAQKQAREKFIKPLLAHLLEAGIGHVSEIVDAELPQKPRGCPFQAWSVGELQRLLESVDDARSTLPHTEFRVERLGTRP